MFFLFALFGDEPEVFLPKYSQTVILHAAHFQRVVKSVSNSVCFVTLGKRRCEAVLQKVLRALNGTVQNKKLKFLFVSRWPE